MTQHFCVLLGSSAFFQVSINFFRLKIALPVLDAVKVRFPETQEFTDSTLKEECEKERMTVDEVIFYKFKSMVLKCLFFCL